MDEARGSDAFVLVLLGERLEALGELLGAAFTHRWVASYQIGFGPPLVRSSARLTERLAPARSALDKLDAYLETCVYDAPERQRLADLVRRQLVRRQGPVEAEALRRASVDVLDLSLRLHAPERAPDPVRADMRGLGVDLDAFPRDLPPEAMSGRFWIHLSDPRGARLLHAELVRRRVLDLDRALAVELRVPVGVRALYAAWCHALERDTGVRAVQLGEPASVARASRNGSRR